MSHASNDIIYDELADILPGLTPEEQADVEHFLKIDLEVAWHKAVWYDKQHSRAYLRRIKEANDV